MKLFLLDANALIHRLYHALPRFGKPIQAIYGLINLLLKFIDENKPDYIFALYDRPEPTIRHLAFKDYKATRPETTEDLREQILLSKDVFDAFNIPIVEKIGYEADDLIASLKRRYYFLVDEIIILTGDLDTLQLVDDKTKIVIMKKGISEVIVYDNNRVKERFGILPSQITDYKALVGDASDNIIGVPGIGEKTASKLLQEYQSLENIIDKAKKGLLDKKIEEKILAESERLIFNKNLVTLKDDLDLVSQLEKYSGFNQEKLLDLCQKFNFKSILSRLNLPKGSEKTLFSSVREISSFSLTSLTEPYLFFFEDDKLKIINNSLEVKIISPDFLKKFLLKPGKKFVFDLKNIFKKVMIDDFYFDKQLNLNDFYDLKIIFWLLNPDRGNLSLENILSYSGSALSLEEIFNNWLSKLRDFNLEKVYFELEVPIVPILARMELYGLKVDQSLVKDYKTVLLNKAQKILEEMYSLAGQKFNPNSPKELRLVLSQKLKINLKKLSKTAKGEISTREDELLKIVNEHPIIPLIIDYRKIIKLANTYTDSLLRYFNQEKQRIYPFFNQTGTNTGRIITEQPNLQSLPAESEIKKAFVADEGYIFISADYSQLELRLLAHLSQDENLLTAFANEIDIHTQTAKLVFGEEAPETRHKAKAINFGITYGITAKGLADRLQISISEANKLIERFFYFYPGVKKFKDEVINFAKTYGYAETLFGRKKFIPEINSLAYRSKSLAERMAINMPIQGLAADLFKKVMIEIDRLIFDKKLSAFMVLAIHDELIFEVKEDIKEEFKLIIKEVMEKVIDLRVNLKVNLKEGATLAEL